MSQVKPGEPFCSEQDLQHSRDTFRCMMGLSASASQVLLQEVPQGVREEVNEITFSCR